MYSKLDTILTPGQISEVNNSLQSIISTLDMLVVVSNKEKKQGWKTTVKARAFCPRILQSARIEPQLLSASTNLEAFEKDILLAEQMHQLLMHAETITSQLRQTYFRAQVEASDQALYIYKQFKAADKAGVGGRTAVEKMEVLLPRTGKKVKKSANPDKEDQA